MEKRKMNKKVRLCLVKIFENGNYLYKIEGALFIVSILNSSKAFGYHLKKQVGQTLGAEGSEIELFRGGFESNESF